MYIRNDLSYTVLEKISNKAFQALWVEIHFKNKRNIICGVVYRQHNSPENFQTYFEDTLDKFSALGSNKPIYVMGDFNINLLKAQTCQYTQNFLFTLQSYALTPTIDKPTRVYNNNSATLIDNIFVNKIENSIVSGNIVSDISDHFSQFCINQPDKWQTKHRKKICDFSHFSESSFNADLAQINWNSIIANKRDNIDKLFTTFYDKVNNLTSKYAPLKLISKRMIKQFSKPWITKGIRRVIKIKNKLYYSADKNKYTLYRNKITILTRIGKKSYFHEYFNNNLTNVRKTWEVINNLINRKITVFIRCPIKKEMIKNPKDIPDILNKHFSTIGKKLASKLPNSNTHFSQYLNSHNYLNSFFLYLRSRYICYRKHTIPCVST
jgi:hypothetical protein